MLYQNTVPNPKTNVHDLKCMQIDTPTLILNDIEIEEKNELR